MSQNLKPIIQSYAASCDARHWHSGGKVETYGAGLALNITVGGLVSLWAMYANGKRNSCFWAAVFMVATEGFVICIGLQVLSEIICQTEAAPPLAEWWRLNFAETCGLGTYFVVALIGTQLTTPGGRGLRALLGKE